MASLFIRISSRRSFRRTEGRIALETHTQPEEVLRIAPVARPPGRHGRCHVDPGEDMARHVELDRAAPPAEVDVLPRGARTGHNFVHPPRRVVPEPRELQPLPP